MWVSGKMSHFVELPCNKRTKVVSSPACDGMKGEQRKVWHMDGINSRQSTGRGMNPVLDPNDRVLASLLRRFIFVQPPPEVWDRIKENVNQMRLTQLTR